MSSSSKAGSPSKIDAEIARLMRDPDALRSEREGMQRPGGHGHYDPNQPRVPAGDPKGGQFASKGYRGGELDRDARVAQASLDGVQLAQLGQGPRDADAEGVPLESLLAKAGTIEAHASQVGFLRTQHDFETNRKTQARAFEAGRFELVSTGSMRAAELPDGGNQFVVSSTTYAYDPLAVAYATIPATPARPIEIRVIDRKVFIREFRR
jgi:hypothetical protein